MGLSVRHAEQFRLGIIKLNVCISVQRDTDIAVPHDILQRFGVHARLRHIGTERMSADMVNGCAFILNALFQ